MLKILVEKWDKNKKVLEDYLRKNFPPEDYDDLVKATFDCIYNTNEDEELGTNNITKIDDGDYQGTLLYVIPFKTYQPSEYDYLMTYIGYGSCSVCDPLESIVFDKKVPTEQDIKDLMGLCKDIVQNTIKPYNTGWRQDEKFEQIEE